MTDENNRHKRTIQSLKDRMDSENKQHQLTIDSLKTQKQRANQFAKNECLNIESHEKYQQIIKEIKELITSILIK